MEIVGKIALIFFAIYVLIINPILNILQEQDETSRIFVYAETVEFLEMTTNKGQVSEEALDMFERKLSATGNVYDVELTHYKYVLGSNSGSGLAGSNYVIKNDSVIENKINTTGYYSMDKNDYFSIEVEMQNRTLATQIQEFAFKLPMGNNKMFIKYGGVVKNAPY